MARRQKILVAEDTEGVRKFISRTLKRAGFDVNEASDGEAVWNKLQREQFDLLVTDNEMPRLAGIKLIGRIRDARMSLPVIMISGCLSLEAAQGFAKLQITAVIPKPLDIWEFQTMAGIALRMSARDAGHGTHAGSPVPCAPAQTRAGQPARYHVMIADDDATVRGSLAAVLESEGYVVDEASNGIEAVNHAIHHKPDLVLLDLNMPYADGWTAFNQLDRVAPLLPVIVITARPNQYPEAVRAGVDVFMEKPLNIPILVKAVKRLTNEDKNRHVRRITDRAYVTQLLRSNDS